MQFRQMMMGLQTVLGLRRRGFFIPYRYADTLPEAGGILPYDPMRQAMISRRDEMAALVTDLHAYADDLKKIGPDVPPAPRWNQDWFPVLDAAMTYTLVRKFQPKRIVEVGSGHSTRFIARAIADQGSDTKFTAIDPQPRAVIQGLPINFIRATLARAPQTSFAELEAGDVLFIDSSHILMPGSDVDDLFNRILPMLPAGVLVHIHDIFLPDDYPASWAWRGYNEQSAVASMVLAGGYEIVFSSHYVRQHAGDILEGTVIEDLPRPATAHETSLWLRKTV
jgi:predicted O-methyltransferase YrrM